MTEETMNTASTSIDEATFAMMTPYDQMKTLLRAEMAEIGRAHV